MSAYVIDTAGEFVHMERTDGEVSEDMRTAPLKARTALKTRQPTSIRAAQLKNDPGGWPRSAMYYGFFTDSGAAGVSGLGADDESCAIAGLKAAFADHVTVPAYPASR